MFKLLGSGTRGGGDGSESCGGFGIVGGCSYVRRSLLYCAFVQLEVSWDHFWKWAAPRRLGWQGRAAVRLCQAPQWGSPGWHFRTVFAIRSPAIIKYQFRSIHLNSEKGCNECEIASRHGLSLVTTWPTFTSFSFLNCRSIRDLAGCNSVGAGGDLFFLSVGPGVFGLLGMFRKWCMVRWEGKCRRAYYTFKITQWCQNPAADIWTSPIYEKKWGTLDFFASFGTGEAPWNCTMVMRINKHAMSGAETQECRTPYQGAWGVTCDKGCLMCLASVRNFSSDF